MIVKYRDKVKSMESKIEAIMTEEEAERTIAKAEIEANKAIKSLESRNAKKKKKNAIAETRDEGQRQWFQSHKDRSDGKITFFYHYPSVAFSTTYILLNTNRRNEASQREASDSKGAWKGHWGCREFEAKEDCRVPSSSRKTQQASQGQS